MSFSLFLSHGLDSLSGKIATMETSIRKLHPFWVTNFVSSLRASQSVPATLNRSHQSRARKIGFIQFINKYVHYIHVKPFAPSKNGFIKWSDMRWGRGVAESSLVTWSRWSPAWPVWWAGWSQTGCTFSSSVCPSRRFEQDNRDCLKQDARNVHVHEISTSDTLETWLTAQKIKTHQKTNQMLKNRLFK